MKGNNLQNILISVVIPVYNVEKYLDQCIDSVVKQTYRKLDIILVEDGSPDSCPEICDAWANKDSRIRVIHQANKGLGAARNIGTKIARGEFIIYIDSDDWISDYLVESLINAREKFSVDIVLSKNFKKVYKRKNRKLYQTERYTILSGKEIIKDSLYQKAYKFSIPGNLFRTSIMRNHPFPESVLFEDLSFVCGAIDYDSRILWIDQQLYFYYQNPNSITHMLFSPKLLDILDQADILYQYIKINFPELENAATCRRFSVYCYVIKILPDNQEWYELRKRIWNNIKLERKNILRDKNARLKNRIAALLSYGGPEFLRRVQCIFK